MASYLDIDMVDHTSLIKMNHNLTNYLLQEEENRNRDIKYSYAVLLTTGAFNPIHCGHIDMMELAKIELEKKNKNIRVIGGFISPSHDKYLSYKFGTDKYIPSIHRIKMINISISNSSCSSWISCDEWESQQKYFIDFPDVAVSMMNKLREIYCNKYNIIKNKKDLNIYYVCGLDHAQKCSLLNGKLNKIGINTLIIRRPNEKLNRMKLKSNYEKGVIVVDIAPIKYDRSSTIIRNLLKKQKWYELDKYLNIETIKYLQSNPQDILQKIGVKFNYDYHDKYNYCDYYHLLIYGYIRKQQNQFLLYMNLECGINKIIFNFYPKIIKFGLYDRDKFITFNNNKEIKGNNGCNGYMIYADISNKYINGYRDGIHFWSIQALNPNNDKKNSFSKCFQSIGVTSIKLNKYNINEKSGHFINDYDSFFEGCGGKWKYNEIITIKLNCNDWTVTYYKNKNKIFIQKDNIIPNKGYYFVLSLCSSSYWTHMKIVDNPHI